MRRLPGLDVEAFTFRSQGAGSYVEAARSLRRLYGRGGFDIVHAHFGLSAWPALALRTAAHGVTLHGTDLVHPRSRAITLAALPFMDLVAPVSEPLAQLLPRWAIRGASAVLPCGVDMTRFEPIERARARRALGLPVDRPCLLFPADPGRPEKGFDRARAVAGEVPLMALRGVDPAEVPLWVNAANAVLVTSERESFGLAVLEALACEVPVLSTPVGVAPEVLGSFAPELCRPFHAQSWKEVLAPFLEDRDPRLPGARARTEPLSSDRMAARVMAAWRDLLA